MNLIGLLNVRTLGYTLQHLLFTNSQKLTLVTVFEVFFRRTILAVNGQYLRTNNLSFDTFPSMKYYLLTRRSLNRRLVEQYTMRVRKPWHE